MGCLWGRVKSSKGSEEQKIKKMSSDVNPQYENYSDSSFNQIEFDPHYKLEQGEIFYIELIEEVKNLITNQNILKLSDTNTTEYDQLEKTEWSHLDYLIYFENSILSYQRIVGKKYLKKKKVVCFFETEEPILEEREEGIVIHDKPDAIYNQIDNKIYFKEFTSLNKIFKGIDDLYRQASKEEVTKFLNSDLITNTGLATEDISIAKRKKIAQAIDKIKTFTDNQKNELVTYGKKYHQEVYKEDKLDIKDNNDLDLALKIIFEKFYTSEVTKEQREANSIRVID